MKYIVIILFFTILICGCRVDQTPKHCAFRDSDIYYHRIKQGFGYEQLKQQYSEHDGKYYHTWCYKLGDINKP